MTSFTFECHLRRSERAMDDLKFLKAGIFKISHRICIIICDYETPDHSKYLHTRRFITIQPKLVFTNIIKVRLIMFLGYFSKTAPKIVVALLILYFLKVCVPILASVTLKLSVDVF